MRFKALFLSLILFSALDIYGTGFQIYREPSEDKLSFLVFFRVSSNDLIFLRDDSLWKATYRLVIEVFDEKGEVVQGEIVQRDWHLQEYMKTLMRSVTDDYSFSFYVEDFNAGKIGVTFSDVNSCKKSQLFVSLDNPVRTVGEILIMKDDSIVFGDELGYGERYDIYSSSVIDPCIFSLSRGSVQIETEQCETSTLLGQDIFRHTFTAPKDTGFYIVSFSNGLDTTRRTIRVINREYLDSVMTEKMVEELVFAVPPNQLQILSRKSIEDKAAFLNEFWGGHDPTPSSERNEVMEIYYRRIEFADERFVEGTKGWKTDRGRIYVLLGLPDEIEDYSFQLETRPFQIWYYYSRGLKFTFVDEHLIGNYELTEPRGWLDVWRDYFDYN
ncbi:GWxTD domain-containing protein [candidate division WOR-3 bacterium]|nr:GWxTD domain-containing protein [candidate division WOR-3 bacterium]